MWDMKRSFRNSSSSSKGGLPSLVPKHFSCKAPGRGYSGAQHISVYLAGLTFIIIIFFAACSPRDRSSFKVRLSAEG